MFDDAVIEQLGKTGGKPKELNIDYELNFEDINDRLLDELARLEPFGANNPSPIFMAKNIKMFNHVTTSRNHTRMQNCIQTSNQIPSTRQPVCQTAHWSSPRILLLDCI